MLVENFEMYWSQVAQHVFQFKVSDIPDFSRKSQKSLTYPWLVPDCLRSLTYPWRPWRPWPVATLKELPMCRLPSAFHKFGNNVLEQKSQKRKKSSTKISLQPGSVKRRNVRNGSRQKQSPGRKLSLLKPTLKKALRPHYFAETVRKNQAVAKVSRSVMSSKTKLRTSHVCTDRSSIKSCDEW